MSKLNKFEDVDVFASLDAIMKQNIFDFSDTP